MARQVYRSLNSANLFGLALAALLAASLPAGAAEAPPVAGLDLSAEMIEYAPDTITASGQVNLKLEGLEAQGEELRANLGTHMVLMPGPVTLTTSSGVVTGESLAYSWDERRGSLAKVDTTTQGIRLTGQEADISADALVLKGGLFTKCLLPTPEYAFLARKVEVDSEKSIVKASGVTLALWGHRVLPLPNLRFSLKDTPVGRMSRERLPIPTTGFDSTRGFYVAEEVPFYLSDEAIGLVGAGYGTKEGGRLTFSGLYTPTASTTLSLDARWIQRDAGTGAFADHPAADLDGKAELAVAGRFGRLAIQAEERDDDGGKDLSFLPRVAWTSPALRLAGLTLAPSAEWAQIREAATGVETQRQVGSLAWVTPSFTLPTPPFLPCGASFGASGSLGAVRYGTGDDLTATTLLATLHQPLTPALALTAAYNRAANTGSTPFAFDRPERHTEGELGLSWRTAGNALAVSAVYDLSAAPGQTGPALNHPTALKGSASLTTGRWTLASAARYELGGAPHYSELTVNLTRHLHCFDFSLKAEPLDQKFSVGVVLR